MHRHSGVHCWRWGLAHNGHWGGHNENQYSWGVPRRGNGPAPIKRPGVSYTAGQAGRCLLPCPQVTLPLELKREVFALLSRVIARQIKRRGLSEGEVLADFERWRKERRATRRGR